MTTIQNVSQTTDTSDSAPFVELHHVFAARTTAISPSIERLMKFIRFFMGRSGTAKAEEDAIEMAPREGLANAVVHGSRENPKKQVYVTCRCSLGGEVQITVRDEGEVFDSRAIPDPTEPGRRLLTHGRGLHIMKALMDQVSFDENGTVIRIQKRTRSIA